MWGGVDRCLPNPCQRCVADDCKKDLGSREDRHEHIGKGFLGVDAFRWLMNDPRFDDAPMLLDTPKGPDCAEDRENLALLRSLVKAA